MSMKVRVRRHALRLGPVAFLVVFFAVLWPRAVSAQTSLQNQPAPAADCEAAGEPETRGIEIGTCVRSSLDAEDPTIFGYVHYEDYRLILPDVGAVQIDMDAITSTIGSSPESVDIDLGDGGFDTFLEVRVPGQEEPLVSNDDRGDSLNSTILFLPPSPGTYIVRARALGSGTGEYMLRVSPAPAVTARDLVLNGATLSAALGPNDPQRDGRYFEEYRLQLDAGQVVQVDMESSGTEEIGTLVFDPMLAVYAPNSEDTLEMNDDRGDSLDARLVFRAPVAGEYRVRAHGISGSLGEYTIRAVSLPALPEPASLANDRAEDVWQDGSPATERGGRPVRYMEYTFRGERGERIQIDANSTLRPHLMMGTLDRVWITEEYGQEESAEALGAAPESGNDDSGDYRARVLGVLPESGSYIVRLEVPAPADGRFDLTLTRLRQAPSDDPGRLDPGRPVEGQLGLGSGMIMDSYTPGRIAQFYQLFALPVTAGEIIVVSLDSSDFDPVLDAGTMSLLGFAVAMSNDDSDGLNSRLELRPQASGTVYLRARSLRSSIGEGRFTLRAQRSSESSSP